MSGRGSELARQALAAVSSGRSLDRLTARATLDAVMAGEATSAQIAALLVALRMKGETVAEITGFAESMRAAAVNPGLNGDALVDTCGTGGDGADTFNVSTAAALVAAGAGVRLAKHGNRAVSSACGSADVLEELGVHLLTDSARLCECLDHAGIVFLFAPAQHPAMSHAVGPRRELGLRTVFNLLGPLTNPAGARRQVVGVYDPALVPIVAAVLGELGAEHALVVHGAGGLDELSTLGVTRAAEWRGGAVTELEIDARHFGLETADAGAMAGGDAAHNASILRRVLAGEPGAPRDLVVLNAAAAIHVSGGAADLGEGVAAAREAIDSGAAGRVLERLVEFTAGAAK